MSGIKSDCYAVLAHGVSPLKNVGINQWQKLIKLKKKKTDQI